MCFLLVKRINGCGLKKRRKDKRNVGRELTEKLIFFRLMLIGEFLFKEINVLRCFFNRYSVIGVFLGGFFSDKWGMKCW